LKQNHCVFNSLELSSKLRKGSLALLPTDTLPALSACPENAFEIWNIKKRPLDKPLILMGSSSKQLFENVLPIALDDAYLMAGKYWPGALTMILPAKGSIVDALNPGKSTLGMRIPDCGLTIDLISRSGPLATTSANIAGDFPCFNETEASNCFPNLPLLGPLPWPRGSGLASTLILWKDRGCWQVLRSGAVIIEDVKG